MKSGACRVGQQIIDLLDEAENADSYLACLLMPTAVSTATGKTKELALSSAKVIAKSRNGSASFNTDDNDFPPEEIDPDLFG